MSQLENTQSVVLQQQKDQKLYLDVQHSTDWVVFTSIIVSAIISFIGFLVTINVVRKSTQAQIDSNKSLIQAQSDLKIRELNINRKSEELIELRKLIQQYISCGVRVRYYYSQSYAYSDDSIFLKSDHAKFKNELRNAKIDFELASNNIFTYLVVFLEFLQDIQLKMMELISVVARMIENEKSEVEYNKNITKFLNEFITLQNVLKTFLQNEVLNNKGE